jgi:chitin synthase
MDDVDDSAPLLTHATPDARFGIPDQRRFQLSDAGSNVGGAGAGDMGVVPGAWSGGGGADQDDDNVHYGPVPTRVMRRNRTQKRVA